MHCPGGRRAPLLQVEAPIGPVFCHASLIAVHNFLRNRPHLRQEPADGPTGPNKGDVPGLRPGQMVQFPGAQGRVSCVKLRARRIKRGHWPDCRCPAGEDGEARPTTSQLHKCESPGCRCAVCWQRINCTSSCTSRRPNPAVNLPACILPIALCTLCPVLGHPAGVERTAQSDVQLFFSF
jgi:hypothetical protein